MFRKFAGTLGVSILLLVLIEPVQVHAQREQTIAPPENSEYGRKFFDQLRSVFGRFRDADLQRAFQMAKPIQCSELVNDKGEWRPVAFFNEKRELGDWYLSTLEEVQSGLEAYVFKGLCRGDRGPVQVVTKFPVDESLDSYNAGKIGFKQIDVNVNAPVSAVFDPRNEAYSFDLPYLFLVSRDGGESVYSLNPPTLAGRGRFATDVTNHWDCKSVSAEDVTYQFLICRTATSPRGAPARNQSRNPVFGASAYFILSDGKEASASVKLSFGDLPEQQQPTAAAEDANRQPAEAALPPTGWETPAFRSRIIDLGLSDLRVRFNAQTWAGKLGVSQVLADQKMSNLQATKLQQGVDYCTWLPGTASLMDRLLSNDPDEAVAYSVSGRDRKAQSPTSLSFEMKTHTGVHLGTLQCVFPRAELVEDITFDDWIGIVGGHLNLEVRP